ncbi:CUB and sushi domain-containing protein 3-like isoform X2 [Orbicella faveolata]|uniref:CUB and sushi domain-containing protein 3-like isoform X2 n=1 Tax=Orbicella faveolata TaxID=48498 RepID=UPI0009E3F346|nr:CUB and sushi domain-containing protein 3-like isoform X2 [Orbicella faveolata]
MIATIVAIDVDERFESSAPVGFHGFVRSQQAANTYVIRIASISLQADDKMRIILTSLLLWMIFSSRTVKGQSECQRTNRQPSRICVAQCDPSTGCSGSGEECLCDGDCGYSCVKKDLSCGKPPNVRNAEAQYPSTKFGETVTYVCNKGYTLSGAPQRTCRANENWDGVGPNCLRMCTLPNIPFSTYIKKPDNFNRTYMTGERITLACKKGFKELPNGNPVRICINGLWTRFPFKCEGTHSCKRTIRAARTKCTQECSPESGCGSGRYQCLCDGSCGFSCVEKGMSCGNPPSVQNGKLNFTGTSYNSTAHYTCNEGYNLNTDPVKRCTAKKRWDGLTPRCLQDCPEPAIPRNANISNPSKKYRSGYKVTFKCNKGFNQEGMATQMCFLGRWTVLPFKCTEGGCGDPGTPENGRKLGVTYSGNSVVFFNCDLGYDLVGSPDRKCLLNGTWTGTQPVCKVVNCGFPPRPKNGSFMGNETTFQSSLQFKCDDGFYLEGSETRMCTSDKNWSGKEVSCIPVDCRRLPIPLNGSLSGEETTYPNHVKINCDKGFIVRGSRKRTCQADGRWDGNKTSCEAVDCGAPTSPINGSSSGTVTTFSNTIKFSCDVGFDLVGSSTRTCMADKTWSGEMPVCKAVDCGKLAAPMNGTLLGKETTFLSEVEIICDEGFILRGSRRRKCQADRNWSGDTTVCEAINCGKPALPDHGSVSGVSTRYPHPIKFTCDTGYEIQGAVVRRCQADGTWSGNKTSCKPVDCGPLQAPNNGTKTGDRTTFLNEVIFYCDDGHDLMGSSSRVCQANKRWSGEETSCRAKDCGQLAIPTNGSATGQKTTYPNEITFHCDNGFNIFGSRIRKCLSDGIWSGNETSCSAKDCGSIETPLNGTKHGSRTTYSNIVTFTCDDGFDLKGSDVRECKSDGKWSGVETFCEAKDCGFLQVPVNGSLVGLYLTTFPNSLTFACDPGFILKGSRVRHCEANAVWSGNETVCQAKDCGPLHAPANGSMLGDLTTYPHDVSFGCDGGFILRGSKVRSCTSEGTWNGTPAFCEAKDCGSLAVPLNGSVIGLDTTFPNEIAFRCDDGFNMAGSRIRKCLSTGIWSGNQTSCTVVDCGYVPTPQNGTKFGEETTYPNSIELSCDEGFVISGSTVRSCLTNGTWSGQQTRCKAEDCGPISVPLNGTKRGEQTTYPSKVMFTCDDGFDLRGSDVRQCKSDGEWSGVETSCQAKDCGIVKIPLNGSSVGPNRTTFPNSLTFTCEKGFLLKGSRVRHCQANATWSGSETYCQARDCGPIEAPSNGSIFGNLTVYPHEVSFDCDEGFILKGSSLRRCTSEGAWSGTPASCEAKDCGILAVPTNSSATGHKTTYPNKITFSCDDGFNLAGSRVRYCQSTGIWSGNQTSCIAKDCGPLSVPMNGSSNGRETTFPNSISFTCDIGFVMIGSRTRKCQSNGRWSGNETSCKAVQCGPLVMPMNVTSYGELTTYPNKVYFQCDEGFVLKGSSVRVCLANGSWSGNDTACKAVDCGKVQAPRNGSVLGDYTTFPNKLRFHCDDGFILRGSTVRSCMAKKTWSGQETTCEAKDCGPLLTPKNGSMSGGRTTFPNEVNFSCDEGFIMKGPEKRRCQADGTWSGNVTSCEAVDCGRQSVPLNGSSYGDLTVFPESIRFSCDTGFILSGSRVRNCQANGTWSGIYTICNAVDCGSLPVPVNGTLVGEKTTFPNVLKFLCDEGFTQHGPTERRCQPNGSWSGNETSCQANDCGPLAVPKNGSSFGNETTYPNKMIFSCDKGFILIGSVIRQCQANRTWSGLDTSCKAIDCGFLGVPLNGSSSGDLTVFPNTKRFACDPGFLLGGSSKRTCQANGNWSGYNTTCTAIDCGHPPSPRNGTVHGERTTYPNILRFKCDEGFTLLGSTARKCRTNGTWSGVDPVCQANDCGKLHIPQNGSLLGNKTTFPNFVTFSCDEGFILKGSKVRHCQANKTWTGEVTYCDAVNCGPLVIPKNGSLSGTSTVFPNSIQFQCDPGFILSGSSIRTCQANGTWSGLTTLCSAIDCGKLQAPQNGSVFGRNTTYPHTLRFTCDVGFSLFGSSDRKCQANGTWSGTNALCQANDCGTLSVPLNGTLSGNLTTYPNKVIFRCDDGFTLRGSAERRCQPNKHWSGYDTFCEGKDCGPLRAPVNGSAIGNLSVFPNKVLFQCDEGFILKGSETRQCQANGLWTGNGTTCKAVDCGRLQSPLNGSLSGNQTVYPNTVRLWCDPGFVIYGSSIRTCRSNGTWDGSETFCEAIDCGKLLAPRNGSMVGKETTYPNSLKFSCDEGFILSGSWLRKCQTNGTWSGNETKCQAQDCGSLAVPANGSSNGDLTVFPNKKVFGCDEGFLLRGSNVRNCQANGTWSGNQTFCEAVDCGPLSAPMNGSFSGNSTVFPNRVLFNCDPGFILNGSTIRTCQPNGTWSGFLTVCSAKDCGALAVPLNGSIAGRKTTFPNTVTFSCDEGFLLNGSTVRRCQADGSWSGIETSCKAVDCGPLSVPANGSASGNNTAFPNSMLFNCDPGFILSGSSKRTCQPNGTWSGFATMCTANDCGSLAVPTNGSSTGKLTTFPNKILFRCDEGFHLRGSHIRHCRENGTWSGTETFCQAVDCGPLSVPINGSSSGDSTVFPNNVLFKCDPGFILNGSTIRTCQPNGSWSGFPTLCSAVDCGPLSVPMNGSSSGNITVFPNNVQFNCDPGFIVHGSVIRTCQANGTWSGFQTLCTAIDCGKPKPLQNGSIIGEQTEYPNFVYHRCDDGFVLRGPSKIKCQTNGIWSTTTSFCEAKDCGTLAVPVNGSINGRETTFPNEAIFSCDEGFILNGSTVRRCQSDGTWSGIRTSCHAVDCGPLSVPINGSSYGDSTVFPNSMLFKCDPGFHLNGSSTRICQANGTWSGLAVRCVAKDCGPLAVPTNGSSTGDLTVFPNRMLFSCDEGFLLRGSDVRHCQANGNWSGNQTFCKAVDCGPLPVPINGSSSGDSTVFPNNVVFNCDHGFILSGSTMRTCRPNGTWSGLPNLCRAVDCGPLSVPMNGFSSGDSTVFPNNVVFSCDPGFILNGSKTRTCRGNGTWSGIQAVCSAVDCGQPHPLQNGSIIGENTVYPNFVTHQCDEGFILRGSPKIKCQANGTWSRTSSFCEAKDCGILSIPLNGSLTGSETTFPNEVTFSCDEGFILNGSSVRRCLSDGSWNGIQTSCEAVDCGPLSVPMNGSAFGDSTVFPNSVLFKCDSGFLLTGSSKRTCQPNGTWNGLTTMCVARDCGPLTVPTNGSSTGDLTVFPDKIDFNCDEGFILRGSRSRRCQANGTWSGNQTYCEAVDCGPLTVPMNGSSSGDLTVFPNSMHFICDPGFILNGSSIRTCQPDGTWSGRTTICVAVDCGPLPVPMNGSSSGNSTVFPNGVRFNCDPGFNLNGSTIRTCQPNGTWNGFSTICSAVDCGRPQPLRNGSIIGDKTVYPNYVNHACDEGFILRGFPKIKCQTNGTWSRTSSFCEAKDCGPLTAPLNGSIAGRETNFPNKVTLSCDEGFLLNGSNVRRCEADGNWSGIETSCKAVDCGPLNVPENGVAHGNSTTYSNVMSFSCKTGFSLQGTATRKCQADGTWTSGEVVCLGQDCGLLPTPHNGWILGSKTTHPHWVDFICDRGFTLEGSSKRSCLRNGSWSGQQPKCVSNWCSKAPDVPAFAYQTWKASKMRYQSGQSIYYSCKAGYIMVGIPVRKCNKGQWSELRFNCSAPSCNAPKVPKYSYVTSARGPQSKYLNGERVYYSCRAGYKLVGIPQIECTDSVWTKHSFNCQAVNCGTLASPSNGWIQKKTGETFGALYMFMCNVAEGYLMRGSKERRCLANATWSGVQPICYLQTCDAPRKPAHGKLASEPSNKYFFGNVVEYQCNNGFSPRGHETTRCQIHGNWSNPAPACLSCSSPLGLKNRMIFSHQLSASSERDSRHGAKHGRLHGNSAWCSARSSFPKYFQIDFGRTMEVTAVATQGHPREQKWVLKYVLKYLLGKNWLTYQESGRDKVFRGNRDGNTVMKHYLKEKLVAKTLRILRHQNSKDFMGSTVCLRAEVYGCEFQTDCLTIGSEVFAHWNSVKEHTRFFHGFITKVRKTSVEVSPSGKHGAKVNEIVERPRAKQFYVIIDKKSKPTEIKLGSEVIVASKDNLGFSQGKVTQKFVTWYGVQLGNGEKVWSKAHDIRLLRAPVYCDRE